MALALSSDQQEQWMLRLVKRAEEVGKEGEIPITALILDKNANCNNKIITKIIRFFLFIIFIR